MRRNIAASARDRASIKASNEVSELREYEPRKHRRRWVGALQSTTQSEYETRIVPEPQLFWWNKHLPDQTEDDYHNH